MAHKVNPIGFRLNVSRKTNSEWFSTNNYPLKLHYDLLINRFFNNISEQYKFLFEKCKIKEYLGVLELRVFIHPYAFRRKRQNKTFILFLSAANKILPILKDQLHSSPHLKIINLPKTVPKNHLRTVKYYLRRFKWKFVRVKKLFIRHLYIINTAIYRSSSILLGGIIAKGIGSRNKDQKNYIRFIKSLISIIFYKGKKFFTVKGIRVKIKGKIHGRRKSRRSRKSKFAFGCIPYSTIKANVNYNLRHVRTKYGVFSIRVWIYTIYPKKKRVILKPKVYTNFKKFIFQKEFRNHNNYIIKKKIYKFKDKLLFLKTQKKLQYNLHKLKNKFIIYKKQKSHLIKSISKFFINSKNNKLLNKNILLKRNTIKINFFLKKKRIKYFLKFYNLQKKQISYNFNNKNLIILLKNYKLKINIINKKIIINDKKIKDYTIFCNNNNNLLKLKNIIVAKNKVFNFNTVLKTVLKLNLKKKKTIIKKLIYLNKIKRFYMLRKCIRKVVKKKNNNLKLNIKNRIKIKLNSIGGESIKGLLTNIIIPIPIPIKKLKLKSSKKKRKIKKLKIKNKLLLQK